VKRLLLPALMCLTAGAQAAPLAEVCCIEDPQLRRSLNAVVDLPPAEGTTPWQRARTAADRVRRYLRSEGYFAASVSPGLGDDERPRVEVSPGQRFLFQGISVSAGEDATARAILAPAMTLSDGQAYRAEDVVATEAAGVAALQNAGWPDAQSGERAVVVDHATGTVSVDFVFEPGAFSLAGPARVTGEGWNAEYIASLSTLDEGEVVNRQALADYRRRLNALQSVRRSTVTLEAPDPDTGRRPVSVELTRAPRHLVEVALSYSTTDGGGATAAWTRRNVWGEDQTFKLEGQLQSLRQGVAASVTLPHWRQLDQTLHLRTGLASEETDAYDQSEITFGFDLTRAQRDRLQYALGGQADLSRVTTAEGVADTIALEAGIGLTLDTRDDPLDPARGFRARAEAVPTASFGDTTGQYIRLETSGSAYFRLTESWVAAGRARLGSLVGASINDIPADHRFYAGGGGSVRGFDYQSLSPLSDDGSPFGGASVAEFGAELRWRDTSRWGGVVFVEAGQAGRDTVPSFDNLRTSIGIGARYYLDFAPIRIDLATPLDRQEGESSVHLYFSIGQAF